MKTFVEKFIAVAKNLNWEIINKISKL